MKRSALVLALVLAGLAPRALHAQARVRSPREVIEAARKEAAPATPPREATPAPIPNVEKRVRVIDVGADVAYLDLGARDGVRLTHAVNFGEERFWVVAVNEAHAAIDLDGRLLALGSEGIVLVPRDPSPDREPLRAQRDAAAYRGQWPKPVLPASAQAPVTVPLGPFASVARSRPSTDLDLSARTSSVVPLSRGDRVVGRSELRGRLRATPLEGVPLALLADASWLAHWARSTASATRPEARVRELELRYGEPRGVLLRAGRLPSPAPMLSELDGARARTAYLGPFAAGAFGGLLPDPIDGRLDDSSTRFGVDLAIDAPESRARPYASLVAHGSTYEGQLDERKLGALFGARPGDVQLHAGAELSLFDARSDLGSAVELSLAHADATYQGERVIAGVRGHTFVPDRSERLRALLETSRVCTTTAGSVLCSDVLPRRYATGGHLALALSEALWLDADVTYATESDRALDHVSGRAGMRWLDPLHPSGALRASGLTLSGSASHDVYYDEVGGRLSISASFAPAFDLTLAYGPGIASYASDARARILHEAQLDFAWSITRALHWIWSTQAELGDDVNALYLGTLMRVRP